MRQPVQVAVYCVRGADDGWEYLLMRRIPSGGGIWQCITGGVEGSEDTHAAALRELKEETGFEPIRLHVPGYSYNFPVEEEMRKLYSTPVETITELLFLMLVNGDNDPEIDSREHDTWKWCRFDDAVKMLYWSGNRESIKHCEEYLRSDEGGRWLKM